MASTQHDNNNQWCGSWAGMNRTLIENFEGRTGELAPQSPSKLPSQPLLWTGQEKVGFSLTHQTHTLP